MNTQERNHQSELDRIAARAGQKMRETAGKLEKTAARAGEGLEKNLDNIETKFNDLRDSVIDKTKETSRTAEKYLHKKPWVAIGISAGVAFLTGIFLGRRSGR